MPEHSRWVRNKELAECLGISVMTLWRWQRDADMGFPQPSVIRGMPYTDIKEVNAWMRDAALPKSPRNHRHGSRSY